MAADCGICYESMEDLNVVTFGCCKHQICKTCAYVIIMEEDVECPFDREQCENVIVRTKGGEEICQTIQEYQFDTVNDSERMEQEMDNNWHKCLMGTSGDFKLLLNSLCASRDLLENMSRNTLDVTEEYFDNLEDHYSETMDFHEEIYDRNDDLFEHFKSLLKILKELPRETVTPSQKSLKIDLDTIVEFLVIFREELPEDNLLIYSEGIKNKRPFMKSLLRNVKLEINSLRKIIKYMAYLIISKVDDNVELYKVHVPNLDGTEEDKCLICTKSVYQYNYTKFVDCNHKICFKCTKTYLPKRGKCPFDGKGSVDFVIYQGKKSEYQQIQSVSEYTTTHWRHINMKILKKIIMVNVGLVKEAMKFHKYIPHLTETLDKFLRERKNIKKAKLKEILKLLVIEIVDDSLVPVYTVTTSGVHVLQEKTTFIKLDTSDETNIRDNKFWNTLNKIRYKIGNIVYYVNTVILAIVRDNYQFFHQNLDMILRSMKVDHNQMWMIMKDLNEMSNVYEGLPIEMLIDGMNNLFSGEEKLFINY